MCGVGVPSRSIDTGQRRRCDVHQRASCPPPSTCTSMESRTTPTLAQHSSILCEYTLDTVRMCFMYHECSACDADPDRATVNAQLVALVHTCHLSSSLFRTRHRALSITKTNDRPSQITPPTSATAAAPAAFIMQGPCTLQTCRVLAACVCMLIHIPHFDVVRRCHHSTLYAPIASATDGE